MVLNAKIAPSSSAPHELLYDVVTKKWIDGRCWNCELQHVKGIGVEEKKLPVKHDGKISVSHNFFTILFSLLVLLLF